MTNPLFGFIKTCALFITGKVQFEKDTIGKTLITEDGKKFTIFRKVTIRNIREKSEPEAYFLVRFQPRKITPQKNISFSLLPMMIFMGFTGFRSKYWSVDYDTGLFQGLYEWQSLKDAENYSKSIAMRFMTNRSYPETVEYQIVDKKKDSFDFSIV